MRVFLKRRSDFVTLSTSQVLSYSITDSIYNNVSDIVITTPSALPAEGDFAYLDGEHWLGIITSVTVDKKQTALKCEQAIRLFSRDIYDTVDSFNYGEDYLKTLIDLHYTNNSDSLYSFPYLSVTAATHTATSAGPDVEKNVFTIASYASKLRRLHNIMVEFEPTRSALNITIRNKAISVKNIDSDNPHIKISQEDYSESVVGKITTYCTETTQQQNWYYWDDGSITSDTASAGPLWALQHQDLTFTNVSVSSWQSSTEYSGYPYKAEISLRGVTENHLAVVTLPETTDAEKISYIATTGLNKVTIYATSNNISLTIPQIVCKVNR